METLGKIGLVIFIISFCWLINAYLKNKNKKIPFIIVIIGAVVMFIGFTNLPSVEKIEETKTSNTVEVPEIMDSGDKTEISIQKNEEENVDN